MAHPATQCQSTRSVWRLTLGVGGCSIKRCSPGSAQGPVRHAGFLSLRRQDHAPGGVEGAARGSKQHSVFSYRIGDCPMPIKFHGSLCLELLSQDLPSAERLPCGAISLAIVSGSCRAPSGSHGALSWSCWRIPSGRFSVRLTSHLLSQHRFRRWISWSPSRPISSTS